MPKSQVSDLITDQEITFADLVLSGTMTDRQAAEAAGLNPDTAAYTKAKPRVRAYMLEHRAAMHDRLLQQESEEQRRQNLGRERVLARLWEIADLDPDMTRIIIGRQETHSPSPAFMLPECPCGHPSIDFARNSEYVTIDAKP
jgi:hypothetical protein